MSIFPFAHFTNPAVLMLLSAGVGICHGISMPILASLVYTASPPGRQAELGGARQVVTFTGMSLTQFLAGSLGGMVGLAPVAWLLALMAGGAAWYTKRRLQENTHAL